MSGGEVFLVVAAGCILLAAVVVCRMVSSVLHPLPRHYALWLVEPIYDLLTAREENPNHFLFSLSPNKRERLALARVVALLSRSVVECNPSAVRRLSEVWGLEEILVCRAKSSVGRKHCEALELLLNLHPSEESIRRVTCRIASHPSTALQQLLLVIYALPERVVELVARHPFALSWDDAGRIVEVLKMHSPTLTPLSVEGVESESVNMLLLRLASTEGVGSVCDLAQRFAQSNEGGLRTAAMNVLLEESLFTSLEQSDVGG